jgi:two-component system cell cycle sensor histidine kinase/response regulator CckA
VEDEAFVREVTCDVLQIGGYRVLSAKDAIEAARLYEAHGSEVDLMLTDVVLPGESGGVLAAKLRRKNPQLKVLLVTGYVDQMTQLEEAREECLAKPFSSDALLRKVRNLLDHANVHSEHMRGTKDLMLACADA